MAVYSCRDMPTIQEFFGSNAFVRGLQGPFGSGKSSACVIELAQRGIAQKPLTDGVRRTRWAVVRNCFDDQTEILTERRGWQLIRDLVPDDRVAALHDGERLVFDLPVAYYCSPYVGDMIGIAQEGVDLLVTPDHRLWVTKTSGRDRVETPYRLEKASDCYGMVDWHMKRDAVYVGGVDRFTHDFYEFLGFWFAEGYAGAYRYPDRETRSEPHWRFAVSQKVHGDYTRDLLRRADLRWTERIGSGGCTSYRISVSDQLKSLVQELALLGHAPDKHLPLWLKESSPAALRSFIHGFVMGDGIVRRHEHESTRCQTTSRRLADDLQEIALRAGLVANITIEQPREGNPFGSFRPIYRVTFLTDKKYRPKTGHSWYRQSYEGTVWCLEVPSHVVYVRRNGRAVWCSQSYRQLEDTTIRTFMQWFPPHQFGEWFPSKHQYTLKALKAPGDDRGAEIEVLFRALDRPDQLGNLLSMELTGAWINEGREVPWAIFDAVQGRCGRYPAKQDGGPSWFGLFADTNPPDVDSDWFKFFEETDHRERVEELAKVIPGITVEKFRQIFKQPSGLSARAENLKNLPEGYYQRLAIGKSEEWIKVFVHGEYGFVIDGKPVWPEYVDVLHCPTDKSKWPRPVEEMPIVRSWDFGLTPACIFSQITPRGQWIVFDELVATSMGADAFSDEVIEHTARYYNRNEYWDVGDPAGAQRSQSDERTCFQILRGKGINIEPAMQTLAIRLESVRKPLRTLIDGRPQFVLHPRCTQLRRALMGGYHYRRMRISGERYTESPEKNMYSHPADALGYGGTRLFGAGLYIPRGDAREERGFGDRTRSSVTGY